MIRLRLFGAPVVEVSGGDPPPELLWRKHLALLIYLHCAGSRSLARAQLLDLLWGDKPESAARHSLNEALRVLRRSLDSGALETNADQVALVGGVESDLREVEGRLAAGDTGAAVELVTAEFLRHFEVSGAAPFNDWVAAKRMEWSRRGSDLLDAQAAAALDRGEADLGARLARRAAELDPGNPAATATAMRAEALNGDRAAALAHYDRFGHHAEQIGTVVPASLSALAARIGHQPAGPATPAHVEVARSRRLPLVGREESMRLLAGEWALARAGGARIGLVLGDPGTGKSRLVEELVHRARLDGATALLLRAVPADADQPGGGVRALAAGELLDASGVAAAPADALAAMAGVHPRWGERFPGALGAAAVPFRQALLDVLRAATGEAPLLLALDDASWLDTESLQILIGLLRDLRDEPFFLLVAHGPDPARPELDDAAARIGRDWPGVQVTTTPLTSDDLAAMVRAALPEYPDDAVNRLARRIAVDSAGLPLLAVELLHAVTGGLELTPELSSWPEPFRTLDQTRPGSLPDVVVAAIRLGFRRLSSEAQRLLAAAAVLGEREPAARLGRATDLSGPALDLALDELEWYRWMRAEPRGYAFVARIAREVVARDLVTSGQRQRIQERAG